MYKIFSVILIAFVISGCLRKMNIEQGNVLPPELVNQIHPGMTPAEVKNILGAPVLTNTFTPNRVDYVYTYKPGHGTMTEKYLTLTFQQGRLKNINSNI